jgi:hypothetical protein
MKKRLDFCMRLIALWLAGFGGPGIPGDPTGHPLPAYLRVMTGLA